MRHRKRVDVHKVPLFLWLILLVLVPVSQPKAQPAAADVAIVLAVDASSSVSFAEFGLQMLGIARALRNPEVQKAIQEGPSGAVALTLMQWSGRLQVQQAVPWRLVYSAVSADALATEIENSPRVFVAGSTAIGQALSHAHGLLDRLPWPAGRRVIDVSGDGRSTANSPIAPVRARILADGIIINGLPILSQEADIAEYYRDNLIGGHGSFVEVAEDYAAFQKAMERKLIREIRSDPLLSWRQP